MEVPEVKRLKSLEKRTPGSREAMQDKEALQVALGQKY
jgi:hypothetical protein